MTNGDKVRSMTDEELAKFLFERGNCSEYCYGICAYQDECHKVQDEAFCIIQIVQWLNQDQKADPMKIGDEVMFCGHTGVIIDLDPGEDSGKILWKHLAIRSGIGIKGLAEGRTGRHFPEVEALLKAMKGEENG